MKKSNFLYQNIAQQLEESILNAVLKSGDKLPSVRLLSKQRGVSPSTVFQAYYQLEAKGLIEARPKSGYYVRFQPTTPGPTTASAVEQKTADPQMVNSMHMIEELVELRDLANVLRLSTAVPSLALLPSARLNKSVVEAIREEKEKILGYIPTQGNEALRGAVARHLLNWGGQFLPDDIVITNGCMEALNLCLRTLVKAGDVVVMDQLSYFGIHQSVESLGLKVIPIPSRAPDGLDLNILEEALLQHPVKAALFVLNFHNPTGSVMPDHTKKALVELLRKHQVPLIEDDIYGELYFGKARPGTCKQFDEDGLVLYCSSFSKTLAAGYRIGYCLPGRFKDALVRQKRIENVSTSTLPQAALLHFLNKGRFDYHLRKLRNALHTQALRYAQCIQESFPEGTHFCHPAGGIVLWVALPPHCNGYELFRIAKDQQISIAPGQIFSINGGFENYIRLSFSEPFDSKIEKAIRKLGELLFSLIKK